MSKVCLNLHEYVNLLPRLSFPFKKSAIPENGIYILFEIGEKAHGGERIVRIGTHTGEGTLFSRLKEHFINENKDRSIFRKNIGRALLNRSQDPYLDIWDLDLTSRSAREEYASVINKNKQSEIEHNVSLLIQRSFSFIVIPFSAQKNLLDCESKLISTVSLCQECKSSSIWLGKFSTKPKIRESGLWQEQGLYKKLFSETEINDCYRGD